VGDEHAASPTQGFVSHGDLDGRRLRVRRRWLGGVGRCFGARPRTYRRPSPEETDGDGTVGAQHLVGELSS